MIKVQSLKTKLSIESKSFVVLDILVQRRTIRREMDKLGASIELYFPCFAPFPESYKSCWHEHLSKVVNAFNCTLNDTTGYSPFGRHPRLPIDFIFDLDQSVHSKNHTEYTKKGKAAMEGAYAIAQKRSSASAERNKHLYDKKVRCVGLQPNDRVLVRNLSERGGPGKLRAFGT